VEWGINCSTVLGTILPKSHPKYGWIKVFGDLDSWWATQPNFLAFLIAIRNDFDADLLSDLGAQIEAEIASDYMGQANELLTEGQSGKNDHVPAAVLAGAVLGKTLRTLCDKQSPPIQTSKPNGESLTLAPLIVALKKADVFKQTMAAQLETWAHIRNKAAHGEFDQFTRQEVQTMIAGIKNFLAIHLG
jgi:hypothetical protein